MGKRTVRLAPAPHRLAALVALAAAIAIAMMAVHLIRVGIRRDRSTANLKQIGAAMRLYHDYFRRFPADIRGKDGEPLLSWRVRILPFLGADSLIAKFRLEEPWDSPHNKALLEPTPNVYALPGARAGPGMTFYRGFSGKDTLFDPTIPEGVDLPRIKDGPEITIAVVEARDAVPWTKPDSEIPYSEEVRALGFLNPLLGESLHVFEQLNGKIPEPPGILKPLREALGGHYPGGSAVLFCDGSVRHLSQSIDLIVLRALITRDQGEVISADSS